MQSRFKIIVLGGIALAVGFLVYLFQAERHASQPLAIISEIQPFTLTDSNNRAFNSQELKGKIWVAHFFFTTCAGVCPVTTAKLAAVYRSYALDKRVNFVSISVNPDNDTPERLTEFARHYKADVKQWHFLTGPRENIETITVKTFKLGSKTEPIFHSSYFVLIDKKQKIRGYYDGLGSEGTVKLFKDISRLLAEP